MLFKEYWVNLIIAAFALSLTACGGSEKTDAPVQDQESLPDQMEEKPEEAEEPEEPEEPDEPVGSEKPVDKNMDPLAEMDSANDDTQSEETDEPNYEGKDNINAWADAYYDYMIDFDRKSGNNEYDGPERRTYSYIYVNDDDIPELVLQGGDEATGNLILTYNDGIIDELQTGRLYFDYIEKENLLRNSDGHMGYYYDVVYSIKNGKWETVGDGEYSVEDNSVYWSDDDLVYTWNGKEVSKSGYDKELQKIYDVNKARTGFGMLGYEEIMEKLRNDAKGMENPYFEDDTAIHRYEVITGDVTWNQAFDECRKKGGYLARINTFEEKYHIEEMLKENKQEKYVFWIGGCLDPKDGHYHWFNGEKYTQEALDVNNNYRYYWLDGEPSFSGVDADGNTVDENYMCMFMARGYWQWNDVPDDISPFYKGKIAYICEYE